MHIFRNPANAVKDVMTQKKSLNHANLAFLSTKISLFIQNNNLFHVPPNYLT